jgi:nucleoside 2-deoxyribosyltransferase
MDFFLRALTGRTDLNTVSTAGGRPVEFTITPAGWERAAELAVRPNVSRTGFVALHFTPEMLRMFEEAFAPAIRRAGFEPHLANVPAHNEQIDARIVREIRQCRFVVADVTGARTGVYFEAGYALGHGRPVIWTCWEDAQHDMHFDTRQYNHILWRDASDLTEQLYERIAATI